MGRVSRRALVAALALAIAGLPFLLCIWVGVPAFGDIEAFRNAGTVRWCSRRCGRACPGQTKSHGTCPALRNLLLLPHKHSPSYFCRREASKPQDTAEAAGGGPAAGSGGPWPLAAGAASGSATPPRVLAVITGGWGLRADGGVRISYHDGSSEPLNVQSFHSGERYDYLRRQLDRYAAACDLGFDVQVLCCVLRVLRPRQLFW